MTPSQYTEDQLVEQPAIALFEELGWESVNAYYETLGPKGTLGRDNKSDVFLIRRLRAAIEHLNPGAPADAVDQAVAEITSHNPQGRLVRPEEVASTVAWLVLPGSESITGQAIAVAGGEVMT